MSRVYLLRHATAAVAAPGKRDFDRELTAEGAETAQALGKTMALQHLAPDVVICSTAARARQTFVATSLAQPFRLIETETLYSSGTEGYLAAIRDTPDASSVMLVGHNPTMEDLALGLCGHGDPALLNRLQHGFPTCGLAVIDFDGPLSDIAPESGTLHAFLTPPLH